MIKLLRYSHDGFKPKIQHHIIKEIEATLTFSDENFPLGLNTYSRTMIWKVIRDHRKLYDHTFETTGIHVFFEPVTSGDVRFFLNHLESIPPKYCVKYLDRTLAYTLSYPQYSRPSTLLQLKEAGHCGAYLPASSLTQFTTSDKNNDGNFAAGSASRKTF